jgi:hypothetical protein
MEGTRNCAGENENRPIQGRNQILSSIIRKGHAIDAGLTS